MDLIIDLLEGFWTWQTPISFLAGVGSVHLYRRLWTERRTKIMFTKTTDGEYRLSTRFWVMATITALIVGWITFRTQETANQVERQTQATNAFAAQTNDCLNQVIGTLKDRTAYNDQIARLNDRRAAVTNNLIVGLANVPADLPSDLVSQRTQGIIETYLRDSAQISEENNRIIAQRATKPYPEPNCGQSVP